MKKALLYSVLSLSLIFPTISNAQCGFDVIRNKQLQNPAFEMQEQANELKIKNFVNNVSLTGKAGTVYTIPVVVHVLHKGEAVGSGTNISDAQIQSGIDRLNEVYRGLDPNSPIDFEIEFTLAQRDPNCNATTGINRVLATGVAGYSASGVFMESVGADETELKDLSKWPETDYCNIWIVSEIDNNGGGSGIQGYANFFNGSSYEGSVMMYTVFGYDPGNTNGWGLNSNGDGGTIVHEFGHYFHLYHTFQGDDADPGPGYTAQCPGDAVVGTDSDGCSDTEIHKRLTSTCPANNDCLGNNPYGLGTKNNYMSYFSCTDRLTANQKTRVTAAMTGTSIVASKGGIAPDPSYAAPVAVCNTNTVTTNNAGITSVELNGTTFTSFSSSSDGGNIDKSANCSGYFEIDASGSTTLNVGMYTVNFQQLGVWIDWNDDGDFNDDAEQQYLANDIAANSTVPIVLTYPASIPYDDYIRIRLITDLDDRYGAGLINSSCYSSIVYGQSEDYAIYVQPAAGIAPVADFSGTPTTLCAGNTVVFTDLSTNTPTSWSWTFTGGTPSSSTLQNPTITYNTAGTYQVQLTATNASGSDGETKVAYITVNPSPSISSHPSNSSINDGDNTSFSVVASNATGYQWQVNTGGGFGNISNGGVYSGATTSTLTITGAILAMDGNTYRCVVSGSCAPTATSNSATLTVNAAPLVPTTQLSTSSCNITLPTSNHITYADQVPGASYYIFNISNVGLGYNLTKTAWAGGWAICLGQLSGIQLNTTYDVKVKVVVGSDTSNYGAVCQVTTAPSYSLPTTKLNRLYCGATLANTNDMIFANAVSGASYYIFNVSNSSLGYNQTKTAWTGGNNGQAINLSTFPGIQLNTTYDVKIKVVIGADTSAYGLVCQVTTPAVYAPSKLTAATCGKTLNSLADIVYANTVTNATVYIFNVSNTGLGFNYTKTGWAGGWSIRFDQIPGIALGTTYDVKVKVVVNGDTSAYGAICQVTTPSSAMVLNETARLMPDNENETKDGLIIPSTTLSIYPNPNSGEQLNVNLENLTPNSTLTITDIYGKVILTKPLNTDQSEYKVNVKFENKLASGFYLVTIISNGNRIVEKLIVR